MKLVNVYLSLILRNSRSLFLQIYPPCHFFFQLVFWKTFNVEVNTCTPFLHIPNLFYYSFSLSLPDNFFEFLNLIFKVTNLLTSCTYSHVLMRIKLLLSTLFFSLKCYSASLFQYSPLCL